LQQHRDITHLCLSTDQEMKDGSTNGCLHSVGSDLTRTRELPEAEQNMSTQKDPSRTPTSIREVRPKPDLQLVNNHAHLRNWVARHRVERDESWMPSCSRLHPSRVGCSDRGPESPWLAGTCRSATSKQSEPRRPAW
jgi:hypothetical protein